MIGPGAMNVFCAACDTRLRTRFDTNGMGATLELVEPCPTCIKSRSAVVITRGPEYVVRHGECDRCGEAFEWKKPGMVPQECSACRRAPKVRTFTCDRCRERIEWTRPGPLPRHCNDCDPRKGNPPIRRGSCRQCKTTITKSTRGTLPKTCKRCKRDKLLACGHFVKRSRGPYPKTCENCDGRAT